MFGGNRPASFESRVDSNGVASAATTPSPNVAYKKFDVKGKGTSIQVTLYYPITYHYQPKIYNRVQDHSGAMVYHSLTFFM